MGAYHEHPSAIEVKYCIRPYLLGRNVALVGPMYNTDSKTSSITLTEGSLSNMDKTREESSHESLDRELCLTAMLFSVSDDKDFLPESEKNGKDAAAADDDAVDTITKLNDPKIGFEEAIETEGLLCVGGYIALKFPQ